MDNDSDLEEERQAVVRRLLDAYFGRSVRSDEKTKGDIVPMGGTESFRKAASPKIIPDPLNLRALRRRILAGDLRAQL
jgi:hypothetical protein